MRGLMFFGFLFVLSLSACSQGFDEKYDDNLEQLTKEADDIQASVDQRMAEGEEADKALAVPRTPATDDIDHVTNQTGKANE